VFLITTLLYEEKRQYLTISIKKFLLRRVFRIWPLYILIFIFAFFIAPHINFLQLGKPFVSPYPHWYANIFLYLTFFPHIQAFIFGPILYCSQAWSIGIEENFYLMWPFLIDKVRTKKIVAFIIIYITIYILMMGIFLVLIKLHIDIKYHIAVFLGFFQNWLKFDCLFIGGLFGIYFEFFKTKIKLLTNKYFQLLIYGTEIVLVITGADFYGFYWEVHALLYGLIIFNLVQPETSIFNFEYSVFDYLGKISYGLYMYHFLLVNIAVKLFGHYNNPFILYPVIFASVICIASASYFTFEKYFLTLKIKYSRIKTG